MKNDIKYKFIGITVLHSEIHEPETDDIDSVIENVPITIETTFRNTDDGKVIFVDLNVSMSNEEKNVDIFTVSFRCSFMVEGVDIKKFNGPKFSNEVQMLREVFVSLSYSTSRGYLSAMLSHYRIKDKVFLPVVNPKDLIDEVSKVDPKN